MTYGGVAYAEAPYAGTVEEDGGGPAGPPVLTASGASSANNGTGNFDLAFTPSANKIYLYLAAWLVDGNSNANQQPGLTMSVPTGSGNLTATPTLVLLNDTQGDDTWETGCVVYKLQAAASPSGTSTLRLSPGGIAVYQWQGFIVEVVDPDETLANIVAQSAEGQTNTIDTGAHTYNLAGSPTSGHTLISVAVYNEDPGSNLVTPTSGWSELAEGNSSAYPVAHIQWRDDTTSATCTIPQLAGSYGNANGITVELVTATGDTPVDLVPSDSVVTVVSDTGSVTQTHVLAPTDSVVTVVSDGGSITQTHALTGTDAVVAVVNDTGSITQTHALTGTDAVVTVVSDTGSITAGVQINPSDSVVTIVADTGSITQTHQIVGTDSHVVVVSDGGTITVGNDIVGIDSVITIISDQGAITQTHALAPTDSVVIVVSDTGTIIAEGDSLIQMRAGELTARWNATPLEPRWEAAELTTRWGATPLTE